MGKVKVIVLGEVNRSPRMMYHSLSLAKAGHSVCIIGYGEYNSLPKQLKEHPLIEMRSLKPTFETSGPAILKYLIKSVWQAISLLMALFLTGNSSSVLCQCPPSVPTVQVCWLYCLLTNTKLILDWHNYAYTILSLQNRPDSWIVKLTEKIEFGFGVKAHANFCVTEAMKNDLAGRGIKAKVLYDRPPDIFKPITIEEKHNFFMKMSKTYEQFKSNQISDNVLESTISTELDESGYHLKKERPAILFSSTSWTPDEDFKILLDALNVYDKVAKHDPTFPNMICVITGKGPEKDKYLEIISKEPMAKIKFVTPWLESSDYPLMVASADFGVCLHTSSSGLDLPMKVIDMFGCSLPVCAAKFKCLSELVRDKENGYTFVTSNELSDHLLRIFKGFPNNRTQNDTLAKLKRNLKIFQTQRWDTNWTLRAKSFFD